MSNEKHPLHVAVGDLFEDNLSSDCQLIRDEACGGNQQIPLFVSEDKSRETEYCKVDLLVLKQGKIRIIAEIDNDTKPTQICGKFLTSGLARYYIHETMNNEPVGMHDSVMFIQILNSSELKKDQTSKFGQGKKLELSINQILPVKGSSITEYKLLYGDISDFVTGQKHRKLVKYIHKTCG